MPLSETHEKKKKKNLTVLALVLGWCLLIFLVTMVKMAHAHDIEKRFIEGRTAHMHEIDQAEKDYAARNATHNDDMKTEAQHVTERNADHNEVMKADAQHVKERNNAHDDVMNADRDAVVERVDAHTKEIAPNPEKWWENWDEKLDPEKPSK